MKFTARVDLRACDAVLKKLKDIETPITRQDAQDISGSVVAEMKRLISSGYSPIKGPGIQTRFPAYKDPKKYPGKRKPSSPVNLELSGDFLNDLSGRAVQKAGGGYGVEVGYSTPSEQIKEQGHREGANGQPKRPTLPIARNGEQFANSIQSLYLNVFRAAIDRIRRRSGS